MYRCIETFLILFYLFALHFITSNKQMNQQQPPRVKKRKKNLSKVFCFVLFSFSTILVSSQTYFFSPVRWYIDPKILYFFVSLWFSETKFLIQSKCSLATTTTTTKCLFYGSNCWFDNDNSGNADIFFI